MVSKAIMMLLVLSMAVLGVMNMGETEENMDETPNTEPIWVNKAGELETRLTSSEVEALKRIIKGIIMRKENIISIKANVYSILETEPKDNEARVEWLLDNSRRILECQEPLKKREAMVDRLEIEKIEILQGKVSKEHSERPLEETKDKSSKPDEALRERLEGLCNELDRLATSSEEARKDLHKDKYQANQVIDENFIMGSLRIESFTEGMRNQLAKDIEELKTEVNSYRNTLETLNQIKRFKTIDT